MEYAGKSKWKCLCDCGNTSIVIGYRLKTAHTKSCGCIRHSVSVAANTTHGQAVTETGRPSSEYYAWAHMLARCTNPKNKAYYRYGGAGITVCDRWKKFENFFADMGAKPSSIHSLDRYPNQRGGYEPDNCRWATPKQQNNNRVVVPLYEYKGQFKTIPEWAEETGLSAKFLRQRIRKAGFSISEAIEIPRLKGGYTDGRKNFKRN